MDADRLSLEDAHNMIREAGNNVNLSISNLEDQELRESEELATAVALNLTEQEDTDTEASHELLESEPSEVDTSEIQHSVASEVDTSELQHSVASEVDTSELQHSVASEIDTSELQHSVASEADTSEIQHRAASVDSEAPHSETSVDDTSGLVRSETSEASMPNVSKTESGEEERKVEPEEEEEYVDVRTLPLLPPRPAPEPERAQRRCWHPVMLDTNPPPIIEESTGDEEYPHKKTLRNIRKLIAEKKVTPTSETLIFFLCNKFAVSEERQNKLSL